MTQPLPKLIVILGPTASGKTGASLEIAKKINGEIISADSRQVYKYMDIGTAKAPGTWEWQHRGLRLPRRVYMVDTIPHYGIDMIDPADRCTVAAFQRYAIDQARAIHRRGSVPLVVGGTGLYIQSVVDNYQFPRVQPKQRLRKHYAQTPTDVLFAELSTLEPGRAALIDPQNRARILRALEITHTDNSAIGTRQPPRFDVLQIGMQVERDTLYTRINDRVDQMIEAGLVDEVQRLLDRGYRSDLPSMSGVGYRQLIPYVKGVATLDSCIDTLKRDTRHYAKRQLTWFRRDKRIHWCSTVEEMERLVQSFVL